MATIKTKDLFLRFDESLPEDSRSALGRFWFWLSWLITMGARHGLNAESSAIALIQMGMGLLAQSTSPERLEDQIATLLDELHRRTQHLSEFESPPNSLVKH